MNLGNITKEVTNAIESVPGGKEKLGMTKDKFQKDVAVKLEEMPGGEMLKGKLGEVMGSGSKEDVLEAAKGALGSGSKEDVLEAAKGALGSGSKEDVLAAIGSVSK